jgi:hypothetical protein
MPVNAEPTPNPNAMKFSVGVARGRTCHPRRRHHTDDPVAAAILALPGVTAYS